MKWGEMYLAPHMQPRITECNACQSDQEGIICMRDSSEDGLCPVLDKGVKLFPENELTVSLFNEVQGSGIQIEGKDKNYIYIRPTEVEALLRIRRVPIEEWGSVMTGIFSLQDMSNHLRLRKKKVKKKSSRRI